MFSSWKQEKAIVALIDEALALAEKLSVAKPHNLESHAAAAVFWEASYLSDGLNLHDLTDWKEFAAARFSTKAETKIASLRKQREYASSDGLSVWLHTARAVSEPRIVPAVRELWHHLSMAGPNADAMATDQLQDAGLPLEFTRRIPKGFALPD